MKTTERILSALTKADIVTVNASDGIFDAHFFNGSPEEGESDPTILEYGDNVVFLSDLCDAEIVENGFKIKGDFFCLKKTFPVEI